MLQAHFLLNKRNKNRGMEAAIHHSPPLPTFLELKSAPSTPQKAKQGLISYLISHVSSASSLHHLLFNERPKVTDHLIYRFPINLIAARRQLRRRSAFALFAKCPTDRL
jgi:hypothetical protein